MKFWDVVGKVLANTAKGLGNAALWASQHPQVAQTVATMTGHPEVAKVIAAAAPAAQTIGAAIEEKVHRD